MKNNYKEIKENIGIDIIDSENNIFLKNIFESFNLNKTILKTNFYTANSYLSNSNQIIYFLLMDYQI